ncbi:response regulator [Candidatus Omnitrophota bacterium]
MKKVRLRCLFKLVTFLKDKGNTFYNQLAEKAPNEQTKKMYYQLAQDQLAHKKLFEDTLSQWSPITNRECEINSLANNLSKNGLFKSAPASDAEERAVVKYAIEQQKIIIAHFGLFEETFMEEWKQSQIARLIKTEQDYEKKMEGISKRLDSQFKKYILLVDDEPTLLKVTAQGLSKRGYRTVTANNKESVMYNLNVAKPGLIFLDIMMPDANGIDMLQEIKQIDKDIPVVMLTAVWDDEEAKRCKDLGALGYVNKPFEINDLLEFVTKVLPE